MKVGTDQFWKVPGQWGKAKEQGSILGNILPSKRIGCIPYHFIFPKVIDCTTGSGRKTRIPEIEGYISRFILIRIVKIIDRKISPCPIRRKSKD